MVTDDVIPTVTHRLTVSATPGLIRWMTRRVTTRITSRVAHELPHSVIH